MIVCPTVTLVGDGEQKTGVSSSPMLVSAKGFLEFVVGGHGGGFSGINDMSSKFIESRDKFECGGDILDGTSEVAVVKAGALT